MFAKNFSIKKKSNIFSFYPKTYLVHLNHSKDSFNIFACFTTNSQFLLKSRKFYLSVNSDSTRLTSYLLYKRRGVHNKNSHPRAKHRCLTACKNSGRNVRL
ncbi:hypothetical protein PUN28_010760 [Cardiocondyla obscurior]|uniref:Uncharacterized protein n=1 Tax=Cardiocondyla obscurior TaxID=286306 RepID=A0AAW2FK88_9HYME